MIVSFGRQKLLNIDDGLKSCKAKRRINRIYIKPSRDRFAGHRTESSPMRKTVVLQPTTPIVLTIVGLVALLSCSDNGAGGGGTSRFSVSTWFNGSLAIVLCSSSSTIVIVEASCLVNITFDVIMISVQSFGILYMYNGMRLMSMLCTCN